MGRNSIYLMAVALLVGVGEYSYAGTSKGLKLESTRNPSQVQSLYKVMDGENPAEFCGKVGLVGTTTSEYEEKGTLFKKGGVEIRTSGIVELVTQSEVKKINIGDPAGMFPLLLFAKANDLEICHRYTEWPDLKLVNSRRYLYLK